MKELSEVWGELTDVTQASILEMIGGKRNANTTAALLKNFSIAEEALKTSQESAGSALAENEKVLESIQGRLNKLNATFQEFASNLIDSSFVKTIITDVTVLLGLLAKLGKAISAIVSVIPGNLNTLLIGGGIAAVTLNIANIINKIKGIVPAIKGLKASFIAFGTAKGIFEEMSLSAKNLASITGKQAVPSLTKLGKVAIGASAGITAAIAVIGILISKYQEAKQKIKDSSDEAIESENSIMDLSNKYSSLLESAQTSSESRAELKSTSLELASALGMEATAVASLSNNYTELTDTIRDNLSAKIASNRAAIKKQLKEEKKDVIVEASNSFERSNDVLEMRANRLDELKAAGLENSSQYERTQKAWSQLNDEISEYIAQKAEYNKTFSDEAYILERFGKADPISQNAVDSIQKNLAIAIKSNPSWNGTNQELYEAVNSTLQEQDWAANFKIRSSVELALEDDIPTDGIKSEVQDAIDAFSDESGKFSMKALNKISNLMDNDGKKVSDFTGELRNQAEAYQYLSSLAEQYGISVNELISTLSNLSMNSNVLAEFEIPSVEALTKKQKAKLEKEITGLSEIASKGAHNSIVQNSIGKSDIFGYNEYVEEIKVAWENYKKIRTEASKFDDPTKTIFGNIDTDTRQKIQWTKEALEEYKSVFESWDIDPSKYLGSYSTLIGQSSNYEGIEIAFSPMLQTDDGAKFLDKQTVENYLNGIINSVKNSVSDVDSKAFSDLLFDYDKLGLYIDGVGQVKNLIAGIGAEAIVVGEQMHFAGATGAIADSYEQIAKYAELAGISTEELIDSINKQEWFDNLSDIGKEAAFELQLTTDTAEWTVDDWIEETRNKILDTDFSLKINISTESEGISNFNTGISESNSATGLSSEAISNLISRYSELENCDVDILFENTAHGVKLNTTAVAELESEYAKLKDSEIDKSLEGYTEQYNILTEKINECIEAGDYSQLSDLYSDRAAVLDRIHDTQQLASQYEGLTSAYNQWINAQSTDDANSTYLGLSDGIEKIKESYNSGWHGIDDFRQAVQLMTDMDVSTAPVEKLEEIYQKGIATAEKYFTGNTTGVDKFMDTLKEVSDLTGKSWASLSEDDIWNIDLGEDTYEDVAKAINELKGLQFSAEEIQMLFDAMKARGLEVNIDDGDLVLAQTEAEKLNKELIDLGYTDITFNFDIKSVKSAAKEVGKAKKSFDKFFEHKEDGSIRFKTEMEGADKVEATLRTLIAQKQALENASLMNIDTSGATEEVQTVVNKLIEFRKAYNEWQTANYLGLDTSEIESKLDTLKSEIADLDENTLAIIGIDPEASEAAINEAINNLPTQEVMAQLTVTATDGTVNWNENTDNVTKSFTAPGTVKWKENKDKVTKNFTARGIIKWGDGEAQGTANSKNSTKSTKSDVKNNPLASGGDGFSFFGFHIGGNPKTEAQGTAYAQGNWSVGSNGVALGGEIGRELIVRNGRFFTIGDNGAEFFRYRKNDIIFNAEQTRQLFENGKIVNGKKRGVAYANGTVGGLAFAGSSGYKAKATGKRWNAATSSSNTTTTSPTTTKSSKTATTKESDALQEKIDELKEKVDDIIRQYEHDIFMAEHHGKTAEEIIAIYKNMQDEVHKYAEEYRKMGLEETSEEIENLKEQWWNYQDEITQLRQDEFDKMLETRKFEIDILTHDNESYDTIISSWRSILKDINDEIDYYTALGYDTSDEVIQNLVQEAWDAEEAITEAFENAISSINEVVDGIQDAYSTLSDAAKEYAENGYLSVDSLQSILELGPKYLDFLIDENGLLVLNEEALQKILAARTEEAAAETALAYAKKILAASNEEDYATLNALVSAEVSATGATWDLAYATLGLAEAMGTANGIDQSVYDNALKQLDKIVKLTKTATSTISKYYAANDDANKEKYEEQKQALDEVIDLTMDLIKYEKDLEKEALEKEKEDYQDIIDKKKESLRLTKEENNYQKSVKEKVKEIAKIQEKITQLSLDDSREAQAERKKLEEELYDLQSDLADTQADRQLEVTEDALDKEYEAFEEIQDSKIEEIENSISSTEKLYQLAMQRIAGDWDELYDDIIAWNYEAGTSIEKDIIAKWDTATEAVKEYGSAVEAISALEELTGEDGSSTIGTIGIGSANHTTISEDSIIGKFSNIIQTAISLIESGELKPVSEFTEGQKSFINSLVDKISATTTNSGYSNASNLVNKYIQNARKWWSATSDEQKALEAENVNIRKQIEALGISITTTMKDGYLVVSAGGAEYKTAVEDIASDIVAVMKNNSNAWLNANEDTQKVLKEQNEEYADRIEDLVGVEVTKSDGLWKIGNELLYEKYQSTTTFSDKLTEISDKITEVSNLISEQNKALESGSSSSSSSFDASKLISSVMNAISSGELKTVTTSEEAQKVLSSLLNNKTLQSMFSTSTTLSGFSILSKLMNSSSSSSFDATELMSTIKSFINSGNFKLLGSSEDSENLLSLFKNNPLFTDSSILGNFSILSKLIGSNSSSSNNAFANGSVLGEFIGSSSIGSVLGGLTGSSTSSSSLLKKWSLLDSLDSILGKSILATLISGGVGALVVGSLFASDKLDSIFGESIIASILRGIIDSASSAELSLIKLLDKFHSGGIVGDSIDVIEPTNSTNPNEVLALLEKGEMVLDENKQKGLFKIIDFSNMLVEKLGSAIDSSKIGNLMSYIGQNPISSMVNDSINSVSTALKDISYNINIESITAPVNVVQKLDKSDIEEHAKMIGEISSDFIKQGFNKRGIRNTVALF